MKKIILLLLCLLPSVAIAAPGKIIAEWTYPDSETRVNGFRVLTAPIADAEYVLAKDCPGAATRNCTMDGNAPDEALWYVVEAYGLDAHGREITGRSEPVLGPVMDLIAPGTPNIKIVVTVEIGGIDGN